MPSMKQTHIGTVMAAGILREDHPTHCDPAHIYTYQPRNPLGNIGGGGDGSGVHGDGGGGMLGSGETGDGGGGGHGGGGRGGADGSGDGGDAGGGDC